MPEYDHSIADVLKRALNDAQDLMRGEIALAKAEMREEMRRMGGGVVFLSAAAVAALMGVLLLLMAAAWALATLLAWPVWAGFAVVAVVVLLVAGILGFVGRSYVSGQPHMPKTVETMKENMEWMRARTS
jgi:VIT1/CCC1 family predicted Fe2+/Mn2+ transporter